MSNYWVKRELTRNRMKEWMMNWKCMNMLITKAMKRSFTNREICRISEQNLCVQNCSLEKLLHTKKISKIWHQSLGYWVESRTIYCIYWMIKYKIVYNAKLSYDNGNLNESLELIRVSPLIAILRKINQIELFHFLRIVDKHFELLIFSNYDYLW